MPVAVRKKQKGTHQIDMVILALTLVLVGFGVIMVFSSSAFFAKKHLDSQFYFFTRQMVFALLGIGVLYISSHFNYQNYRKRKFVYPMLAVLGLMLILVFIPGFADTVLGARRWLKLGPIHLQPSELAKPALIIYLAFSLTKERKLSEGFIAGFLVHLILPLLILGLILMEPDFGTVFLILSVSLLTLFIAGSPIKYPIGAILALTPAMAIMFIVHPHALRRLEMWVNQMLFIGSEQDYSLLCYQVRESLISFGSGKLWGLGLGEGTMKMFFLPQAHSDFILASIGQEIGFVGISIFFMLFGILIIRGYQVAFRVPDTFGCLLAFGLTTMLMVQFSINIGVVLGVLPPKGIALPMISYGGSSLISTMICIGILLNISRFVIYNDNMKRGRR